MEKNPDGIFKPHVVEDRELITGQNPPYSPSPDKTAAHTRYIPFNNMRTNFYEFHFYILDIETKKVKKMLGTFM